MSSRVEMRAEHSFIRPGMKARFNLVCPPVGVWGVTYRNFLYGSMEVRKRMLPLYRFSTSMNNTVCLFCLREKEDVFVDN